MTSDYIGAAAAPSSSQWQALRNSVGDGDGLAPAVIAIAQGLIDGRLPFPPEAWLLRRGLHRLAAARETSVCPIFRRLLRLPPLELTWLFSEDRATIVVPLLLGLFDGDDAALFAIADDPDADEQVRSALLMVLARLAWEGRASRERLLDMLDRLDRDASVPDDDYVWFGWQDAIMLLGLTDWIPRVQRGWDAGRLAEDFAEHERLDLIADTHHAAGQPDDAWRFDDAGALPVEPETTDIEWPEDPADTTAVAPDATEMEWLEVALWRCVTKGNMCLEEADGFLTALAVGPVLVPASEFLPEILAAEDAAAGLDSLEHRSVVEDLLVRHHAAIERTLEKRWEPAPWITEVDSGLEAGLWARGYLHGIALNETAWDRLIGKAQLSETLVAPVVALLPDPDRPADEKLAPPEREKMIAALPTIVAATKLFWERSTPPLFESTPRRATKVGRNEPCPCGSGKKYKRCCGAAA